MKDAFSNKEIHLIKGCLNEAVNGDYFDDDEFQTLFGFYRDEIRDFNNNWVGEIFEPRDLTFIRVTLGQLLNCPHGKIPILEKSLKCKISEIQSIQYNVYKITEQIDPRFMND